MEGARPTPQGAVDRRVCDAFICGTFHARARQRPMMENNRPGWITRASGTAREHAPPPTRARDADSVLRRVGRRQHRQAVYLGQAKLGAVRAVISTPAGKSTRACVVNGEWGMAEEAHKVQPESTTQANTQ